ncbi:MAG: DUF3696 domain-containing protein [Muribaculaceae bacterium]|nr:DUF3696 domain-containing protein [Muribaculaceae bacterium]
MIKTIDLHNFKCFKDESFRTAPLTILAGANGAGKSSLIQALVMLRQSFFPGAPVQESKLRLNGSLSKLISSDKIKNKFSEDDDIRIEIDDDTLADDFTVAIPSADIAATEPQCVYSGNSAEAFASMSLFRPDFVYLYANRISPEAEYDRHSADHTASRLGNRSGSDAAFCLQEALDTNRATTIASLDRSGNGDVASNVNAWISYIVGTKLKVKPDTVGERRVKLIFTPAGGEETDATNMAFGDTYILPIVVGVLTATPGSLMIIENPEAHLHPGAQRRMGEFLARATDGGVQIFIETHSDHLLNGVRLAAKRGNIDADNVVVHFIYEDKGEHIDQEISLRSDGTLENWPSGFFDEWEAALRELTE